VWVSELIYWPGQSRSRVLAITQSELLGPQIFANENLGSGQQGALRMFEVFWGKEGVNLEIQNRVKGLPAINMRIKFNISSLNAPNPANNNP